MTYRHTRLARHRRRDLMLLQTLFRRRVQSLDQFPTVICVTGAINHLPALLKHLECARLVSHTSLLLPEQASCQLQATTTPRLQVPSTRDRPSAPRRTLRRTLRHQGRHFDDERRTGTLHDLLSPRAISAAIGGLSTQLGAG